MAISVLKNAVSSGDHLKSVAIQIRQFLNLSANWTVIDSEGNWTSVSTILTGDYFVIRCNTAWGDGKRQEILFVANFLGGSVNFGGPSDNKYNLLAYRHGWMYSPDGGWDTDPTVRDFTPTGGLAPVYRQDNAAGAGTLWNFCIADCPSAVIFWGADLATAPGWADYNHGVYVGRIESSGPATDLKACTIIAGRPFERDTAALTWGYNDPTAAVGRVPNAAWTAWECACIMAPVVYDGWGQDKNSSAWVQRALEIRDVPATRSCGNFTYLRLADANLTDGDVSGDGLWCHLFGIDWPWTP